MSADRAQHVATVIGPALRAGGTILCDRYFDATIAYQGFGRGLDIEMLLELSLLATSRITPDLTLLLDIPPELSLSRVRARGDADRMELEDLAFHTRVRTGYAELVKRYSHRFVVIDGTLPRRASSARGERPSGDRRQFRRCRRRRPETVFRRPDLRDALARLSLCRAGRCREEDVRAALLPSRCCA